MYFSYKYNLEDANQIQVISMAYLIWTEIMWLSVRTTMLFYGAFKLIIFKRKQIKNIYLLKK